MSVIPKYVSVLFCHSLTGFEAQEMSVILKYVSILSLTGFERVLPVSTGSVGDTEVCVSAPGVQLPHVHVSKEVTVTMIRQC